MMSACTRQSGRTGAPTETRKERNSNILTATIRPSWMITDKYHKTKHFCWRQPRHVGLFDDLQWGWGSFLPRDAL